MKPVWVIGLMSGTSLDGIDAAYVKTDGVQVSELGPGLTLPYDPAFRAELFDLLQNPFADNRGSLEQKLTDHHTHVVRQLVDQAGIQPALIGFHGQTILHRPRTETSNAQTIQIGDGQKMATDLGIPVVYDFRQNDVTHGGEGAPLVPVFHQALAADLPKPVAFVNVGGVANVTIITDDGLYAGDTGPGGALIDDWMKNRTGQNYDKNGETAAKGTAQNHLVEKWLQHPFFDNDLPKSLDRQTFYRFLTDCEPLSTNDGAATLTAFTVQAITNALSPYPQIQKLILTGGGRHNMFLRKQLSEGFSTQVVEDFGWNGDLIEAQAFAYLAMRSRQNLPLTLPTTTGVLEAVSGGRISS
ncbi:anhydro-N-acetylmuramic acid kinase [Candidatus Finniella inopinata]|uniref:Anhydro-N-acetylmuramic acid kinase n=1 Tax=Candidatus Finniella inopinata TaxID=1696036 RepID=A0A4V2DZL8_9PROT|nr:anhydro-N-acetylmuramic acid kinase [Candidatus Finniella inopinata]RZI45507.1 anhydro-N-acetylmuramic acid kinase [Candidatus Finniella inopinata]